MMGVRKHVNIEPMRLSAAYAFCPKHMHRKHLIFSLTTETYQLTTAKL